MDTRIIEKWEQNKGKLKNFFDSITFRIPSYRLIMDYIVEYIFDPDYDASNTIFEIDDDVKMYTVLIKHPNYKMVVQTSFYYGSCELCDLLMDINSENNPKKRADRYMTLCLHAIQRMKILAYEELV